MNGHDTKFTVGEMVKWREDFTGMREESKDNIARIARVNKSLYGKGPFAVQKVEDLEPNFHTAVGHTQWVTLYIDGADRMMSGALLEKVS